MEATADKFNRELLKSEQLRVQIMIVALSVGFVQAVIVQLFFPQFISKVFIDPLSYYYVMVWLLTFMLFEVFILFRVKRARRLKQTIPTTLKFLNIFVEISFPSMILAFFMTLQAPDFILDGTGNLLYFVIIILATLHLDFRICAFGGLLGAAEFMGISIWGLLSTDSYPNEFHASYMTYWLRSFVILIAGLAAGFVASEIKKRIYASLEQLAQSNKIKLLFGQQVSREVVEDLMSESKLDKSEIVEASIMFLDIRNFTVFADTRTPAEVIRFQNQIFSPLIEIIDKHGGLINQILGDGFMATFGAPAKKPGHCADALKAGIQIIDKINALADEDRIHQTRLGIGLHTGPVVTGNIGNEIRKQYSVAGTTVILAARIEQLNKEFNSQFLISKAIHDKVPTPSSPFESLGEVSLKGSKQLVEIFKVC